MLSPPTFGTYTTWHHLLESNWNYTLYLLSCKCSKHISCQFFNYSTQVHTKNVTSHAVFL